MGNLHATIVLQTSPERAKFGTLMGALAVKSFVGLHAHRPRIKWMNDVFVNDQKIAGVLATGQS